ncbi:uncharacterized protein EURHEDRAFT_408929 [Aspergillus ruber CBS 135680]|uniref:Uncharacterized protein n=1 Tax=Aspergillus ruber (strain CBS 135680) TaxID=1388766 RepID=A0A017SQQ6_ASPRC|nr:uncharacterized protein EURHEDRAFT_408929 [Aspergillus ruber CBS 135680]EYE98575.1 hypothetical protein EURHEDRAFT_408929 [Aspergillus ruber CBS 135680]
MNSDLLVTFLLSDTGLGRFAPIRARLSLSDRSEIIWGIRRNVTPPNCDSQAQGATKVRHKVVYEFCVEIVEIALVKVSRGRDRI